jgi:chemotaxis protein MotB
MKRSVAIKLSVIIISTTIIGCVPHKKFVEMEKKYNDCSVKHQECIEEVLTKDEQITELDNSLNACEKRSNRLYTDSLECNTALAKTKVLYDDLNRLQQQIIENNRVESHKLLVELEKRDKLLKAKEKELAEREALLLKTRNENEALGKNLSLMQEDLEKREIRVKELESILHAKDSIVQALKTKITNSLLGFADKGINIEVKNGKVYVSMEEQLLFPSASIVINEKGKSALLELANALKTQTDVTIMVEGHTDNVPMSSGQIKDNWDLSVLRATSIVRILTVDGGVNPTQIMATGRGEFVPLDSADTPEARKQNRRTEIILSPNLDELFKILEN